MFPMEWSHGKSEMNARPHPGPLPQERVNRSPGVGDTNTLSFRNDFGAMTRNAVTATMAAKLSSDCNWLSLSLGERAGLRADVKSHLHLRPRWMFMLHHPLKISKNRQLEINVTLARAV
jgi:hypothetical protein